MLLESLAHSTLGLITIMRERINELIGKQGGTLNMFKAINISHAKYCCNSANINGSAC